MDTYTQTLITNAFEKAINWRRHIHSYPDLSFQEKATADYIANEISEFSGIEINRPQENCVIALLKGKYPGPVWALRADIDALPLQEDSGVEFSSKVPGVMHACGHDAHAAMLMGAAYVLSQLQEKLHGTIKFIFQPAEEVPPGGAKDLIEHGVLNGVDKIFGLHVLPNNPTGEIILKKGVYSASSDNFDITVHGVGGHGSMPHLCVDPIVTGSEIVCSIQHILSRNIDPLYTPVLTVATFQAGDGYNVIPNQAHLAGTLRTHSKEIREQVPRLMESVIQGIATANQAQCNIDWKQGYTVGYNHAETDEIVERVINKYFPSGTLKYMEHPLFSSEDFSSYQEIVPGSFLFIGCGNPDKGATWNVHNPHFCMDEDALAIGIKTHISLISDLIKEI